LRNIFVYQRNGRGSNVRACACACMYVYVFVLTYKYSEFSGQFSSRWEINDASGVGSIDVPIRLACHTQTECEIAPCMHAATMDSDFIHSSACPLLPSPLGTPYVPSFPLCHTLLHSFPSSTVLPHDATEFIHVYGPWQKWYRNTQVRIYNNSRTHSTARRRHTHTHTHTHTYTRLVHWYYPGKPLSRPWACYGQKTGGVVGGYEETSKNRFRCTFRLP
jgi:hypothetical protein